MEYKNFGKVGMVKDGVDVYTFQIGSATTNPKLVINPNMAYPPGPILLTVDEFRILTKGATNNDDEEIEHTLEENRLIPELIEKQVRIMYGKGPRPYIEDYDKDNKLLRKWQKNAEIENWLDSWEDAGLDPFKETAKAIIRRFYTFEEFYSKPYIRATRFLNADIRKKLGLPVPVVGFELVENKRCRLATLKPLNIFEDDFEAKDFTHLLVGNWNRGIIRKFKRYRKLDRSNILKNSVGIIHSKNDAVGKIYGQNKFYRAVKEWIIGLNLTPKNINSFIRNSIAAKIHIIVPEAWCDVKREMLKDYCDINRQRFDINENAELIKIEKIDGTYIDLGTDYNEYLFTQYLKNEIEKCIQFLSGPDQQGKAFSSISFKDENGNDNQWEFKTIDLKYKEYIDSLIAYDKRGDEVLLSAKGLDATISNVSKDGVISKSGSDMYYNYIIYLHTLITAEEICMQPFNLCLAVNFPDLYAQGFRIGLYNDVPQKQEDTKPADRLKNQPAS